MKSYFGGVHYPIVINIRYLVCDSYMYFNSYRKIEYNSNITQWIRSNKEKIQSSFPGNISLIRDMKLNKILKSY